MRSVTRDDENTAPPVDDAPDRFTRFVREVEPRLRRALTSAYGADAGREATAEALAWAWGNLAKVESMRNPAGYLYRVGQTAARRSRRRTRPTALPLVAGSAESPWPIEPRLAAALERLSPSQRVAVLLIDGWGCTQAEAADTMGCRISTVRVHHRRGMAKLRDALGVEDE